MSIPIKLKTLPNMRGEVIRVLRMSDEPHPMRGPNGEMFVPERVAWFELLPVQTFALATQDVRVAFDPVKGELYIGETLQAGWFKRMPEDRQNREWRFEVIRAESEADFANRRAKEACARAGETIRHWETEKNRLVELLKSRKPSVRRRARRALARLGK